MGVYRIFKMIVIVLIIFVIKIGVKICYVILFINIIFVIIVVNINVVFRLFCSNIKIFGINEILIILKNNNKLFWNDLLNVNWLCLEMICVNVKIKIIFMNLDGWILIGLNVY